jgi:hypothetical protein
MDRQTLNSPCGPLDSDPQIALTCLLPRELRALLRFSLTKTYVVRASKFHKKMLFLSSSYALNRTQPIGTSPRSPGKYVWHKALTDSPIWIYYQQRNYYTTPNCTVTTDVTWSRMSRILWLLVHTKANIYSIYTALASKLTKLYYCTTYYCTFTREVLSSGIDCTSLFVRSSRPPRSATFSTRSFSNGIVERVPADPTIMSFFCSMIIKTSSKLACKNGIL